MDVATLKGAVPGEILQSLEQRGIKRLTPPQAMAIEQGLLSGRNMVVSSPTASGKTLIAELACVNSVIGKFKKAVYIAPMRALASEKFQEFSEAYPYIKTALSIGDLDADDKWLSGFQIIFFSTEKFDSLIRHGINWLDSVGCFIFDEIHMIGDSSRGPTMELLITKLREMSPAQMIALSATIGNAQELAEWLDAGLVESDFRPVKLSRSILCNGILHTYENGNETREEMRGTSGIAEIRVVEDTLDRGKQAIIFYSTRRSAEFGAAKIAKQVDSLLSESDRLQLGTVASAAETVLERPTEQCVKLGSLISKGVAFHHAGLLNQQRSYVEKAFKDNIIKVICSTTTLGYGINMPAHTVLVRDTTRFDGNYRDVIGVNEVLQLFGRAGRPKYDTEGRAIISASGTYQIPELRRRYISSAPEPITSSLGVAPVLRAHILAFISERFLNSEKAICNFVTKTLYGKQFGNSRYIDAIISEMLDDLERWGFIEGAKRSYVATKLGKRVSELYIDPLSARMMLDSFKSIHTSFDILLMISNTLEMRPHVKAIREAEERYASAISTREVPISNPFPQTEYIDYDPVKVFSTAMFIEDWTNEQREADIVKKFASSPGALYTKITNADWIIYSAIELATIVGMPKANLVKARVKIRYGIKDELLDLVRLEQIGRARARMLYNNGITKASEITKNKEKVSSLLGPEVAKKIFAQLD